MTSQVIPAQAVEAAMKAFDPSWDTVPAEWRDYFLRRTSAALEAAAPHMLSHEREQTRLAHLDAMVNAETANRLQRQLDEIEATP